MTQSTIALKSLPYGWKKVGEDYQHSTISSFVGGYVQKDGNLEIRVWAHGGEYFHIKDGDMHFQPELTNEEAEYVHYDGTSTEILDMFDKPKYYAGRFYRLNVTLIEEPDSDNPTTLVGELAEDMEEASSIVERILEDQGAFSK